MGGTFILFASLLFTLLSLPGSVMILDENYMEAAVMSRSEVHWSRSEWMPTRFQARCWAFQAQHWHGAVCSHWGDNSRGGPHGPGESIEIVFRHLDISTLQDAAARDEEVEGDGAQDVPEGRLEVTRDFCFSMSEDTGPGD